MHSADMYKGEPMDIALRLLKKLPPHWSRDFDTIEDLRDPKHGIQSMRAMSLEDARNIEQIPLRSGNIEFERNLTDPDITGAKSIVPGIAGGNIYDESLVREGGGFVYRPHLAALAPLSQYTDMPSSSRPNVLVASTEKPEFRASKNEGRIQTEGFMPVGMDPNQAYLLSDPTKPFTREDLLQQARIKQAGGIPYHARSDIEIHPLDGYATASRALETLPNENIENPMTEMGTWGQPRVVAGPRDSDVFYRSESMDIAMRLLKRQTTLSAFDEQQIQENLKPQNSNIFIAAKPGNENTRPGELSQLSDNMLAELAALKEKHGEFGITSATGNAAWDLEPSFMLTNVPQSARDEINAIAEKYRQDSIAVSEQNETGAKFVTPQGQVTDEYRNMQMDPDAEYSTDFPTGQRLTFKSKPMDLAMRLLKNEPADYADTYQQVRNNIGADGSHMSDEELESINRRYSQLHDDESHPEEYYNLLEAIELEQMRRQNQSFDAVGLNEETDFTRSEPMEIAMQLLKERVSPEAKRHKLEYDKKYESSPERVKYREDLNRERRRRHIMGQGGPDMSHTSQHTIVPEDPHTNRARHFKDKGTLL